MASYILAHLPLFTSISQISDNIITQLPHTPGFNNCVTFFTTIIHKKKYINQKKNRYLINYHFAPCKHSTNALISWSGTRWRTFRWSVIRQFEMTKRLNDWWKKSTMVNICNHCFYSEVFGFLSFVDWKLNLNFIFNKEICHDE